MEPYERPGERLAEEPTFGTECRNCGNRVSADFARVFGDNDDRVFHCHECTDERDLYLGAAAQK